MKIHRPVPIGSSLDGTNPFTPEEPIEIKYDDTASERVVDAIHALQRYAIEPRTIVCGVRAYLSIFNEQIVGRGRLDDTRMFVSSGDLGQLKFWNYDMELDPMADWDSIRVTTGGTSGVDYALRYCTPWRP